MRARGGRQVRLGSKRVCSAAHAAIRALQPGSGATLGALPTGLHGGRPQGVRPRAAVPLLWLRHGQPGGLRARRRGGLPLGCVTGAAASWLLKRSCDGQRASWQQGWRSTAAAGSGLRQVVPTSRQTPGTGLPGPHPAGPLGPLGSRGAAPGSKPCAAPGPHPQTASTRAPRWRRCRLSAAPRSSACPPCLQWSWSTRGEEHPALASPAYLVLQLSAGPPEPAHTLPAVRLPRRRMRQPPLSLPAGSRPPPGTEPGVGPAAPLSLETTPAMVLLPPPPSSSPEGLASWT